MSEKIKSEMRMWDTLFKQKKPFMFWDEVVDWSTTRWAFTDMMRNLQDNMWLYELVHFEPGMQPTPFSPFDHFAVTEAELNEYFEAVPESQRDYMNPDGTWRDEP